MHRFSTNVIISLSSHRPLIFVSGKEVWDSAGSRSSARGKGREEGGSAYTKAGSSLRVPLEILEHLPPKPESAYILLVGR